MQKNSGNFSVEDVQRMANSPAGQQLMALLQQSDSRQLQSAAEKAADGDYESARRALTPLLNSPQVQALLKQLGG